MAINIDVRKLPPYLRIIIASVPSFILIILFIVLIYLPKDKEIKDLNIKITKLDNEIASSEVKVRRLDALIAENTLLKAKLSKLQEQLPEEKEVSGLLKQISDLGLKSGLEILLWKPEERKIDPTGLYVEIPVKVEVLTGYHNLGVFFSHISRLPRIVNISDLELSVSSKGKQESGNFITAKFTALTFAAVSPEDKIKEGKR
jgi:type IV pilus assembly protein PilO